MDKKTLENLPKSAGVYLFKDAKNTILYIGKATSLKDRVRSYFNADADWKVQTMVQEATHIDHIATHTESEACVLEAQLIQQHQPHYNALLKEGQPFVFLLFTKDTLPEVKIVRNKIEKGTYFGPFMKKQHARTALDYLCKTFKLTLCNKRIASGCLNYHLGFCAGNCTDVFSADEYLFRIELAKQLLKGNYDAAQHELEKKITEYTRIYNFEAARNLHHYLKSLDYIIESIQTHFSDTKYAKEVAYATSTMSTLDVKPYEVGAQLQHLLGLAQPIHTIDCFDISHFQSQSIVGSCVRFTNGVPEKNKLRRFRIKTLTEQNDYAALQEIVTRRYKDPNELPDLILIDGGKGQLSAVKNLVGNTPIISLAKREERLFTSAHPEGIPLDVHTDIGKLLIALRDYAHHFAISYHRLRRNKSYFE